MKLISVNCGLPREIEWRGMQVTTSIFKEPVRGRVALRTFNLDGDMQSDLTVHGGAYKAVYCYPLGHYDYWRAQLPDRELPIGVFGENFTIDGSLDEDSIYIGDQFAIGSAKVVVTQPRLPCYKLGIRFGSDQMVRRFLASGRTGFYLAVTREGEVGAGDEVKPLSREPDAIPVSAIMRLYLAKEYSAEDRRLMDRAKQLNALPDSWKQWLWERARRRND